MRLNMAVVEMCFFMAVLLITEAGPSQLSINLDVPPEERWAPLVDVFDEQYLRQVAVDVIE